MAPRPSSRTIWYASPRCAATWRCSHDIAATGVSWVLSRCDSTGIVWELITQPPVVRETPTHPEALHWRVVDQTVSNTEVVRWQFLMAESAGRALARQRPDMGQFDRIRDAKTKNDERRTGQSGSSFIVCRP